jgi:hypothetical protein
MTTRTIRTAAVAAAALLAGCEITDPPLRGILSLTPAPAAALADGSSIVLVTAVIDTAARPRNGEVKFTTTAGTLLPAAAATANDSGIARVQLKAPGDSATAIITATNGQVTRTAQVVFTPAPPTRLEVSASQFTLKAGLDQSVDVTVSLLRSPGTVSPGSLVTFSADSARGTDGRFGVFSPPSVLASSATVTTKFTAGSTDYRGPVTIRATAMRSGHVVSDSTVVQVVSP